MRDTVADYIAARDERDALRDQLKPVEERMRALEDQIASEFLALGKTKETRNGTTVYIARNLSVKVRDPLALVDAMRELGMENMLGVHASRLAALCRDMLHDEDAGEWVADAARLPGKLKDAVTVDEFHRVAARKG